MKKLEAVDITHEVKSDTQYFSNPFRKHNARTIEVEQTIQVATLYTQIRLKRKLSKKTIY